MKNFQEGIDNLVNKILSEEIDAKVKQIMENKGEFDEELHGGQSKIDVAEPKGKITAADFKKLRDKKSHKEEVDEFFIDFDNEDSEEEEAEELSQREPTYVGRGLADNKMMSKLKNALRNFGSDYEDEEELDIETDWSRLEEDDEEETEFDDYDEMGFDSEEEDVDSDWQELDLDDETDWSQLEEDEATEGNAFTGALAKAKESGKDSFEVDGKEYSVNESEDKWIQ